MMELESESDIAPVMVTACGQFNMGQPKALMKWDGAQIITTAHNARKNMDHTTTMAKHTHRNGRRADNDDGAYDKGTHILIRW